MMAGTTFPAGDGRGHHYSSAVASWQAIGLCPVVFTNDEHARCLASTWGAETSGVLESNHGTPILSDIIGRVNGLASGKARAYINADIVLPSDLMIAVATVSAHFRSFLLSGCRYNVGASKLLLEVGEMVTHAREQKDIYLSGCDYFIWRGDWLDSNLPPLRVARNWFDWWFVGRAKQSGVPVIDGTLAIAAVHPSHKSICWPSPSSAVTEEAQINADLACGMTRQFDAADYHLSKFGTLVPGANHLWC